MSEINIGYSDIDESVILEFIGKKDTLVRFFVTQEGIWIVYNKYRTSNLLENKLLISEDSYIKKNREKIINDLLDGE